MRTEQWQRRAILFAAFVFTLLAVTSDTLSLVPAKPAPAPPNGPATIVSMGDSTISGEGGGDYVDGTDGQNGDWCHRSANAEIMKVTLPSVVQQVNLACSGADAANVSLAHTLHYNEGSQAAQLALLARTDRVEAILVAVGANDDPQFANVLNSCVQAWLDNQFGKPSCTANFTSVWRARVSAMIPKVVTALRDIRKVMRGAGYPDDSYSLVLQSYAAPLGPDVAPSLQNLNGCPVRSADLQWIRNTGVTVLDSGLHEAANQAGTRFLDLSRAGLGHEACSDPTDPANEWFTRLTVSWNDLTSDTRASHALQQSFHPDAAGYAAFATCLSAFLETSDQAAACLAGPGGTLHPAAMIGTG